MEKFSWVCRLRFYSLRAFRERKAAGTFQEWVEMRRDTVQQRDDLGFISARKPEERAAVAAQKYQCPLDGGSLEKDAFHGHRRSRSACRNYVQARVQQSSLLWPGMPERKMEAQLDCNEEPLHFEDLRQSHGRDRDASAQLEGIGHEERARRLPVLHRSRLMPMTAQEIAIK